MPQGGGWFALDSIDLSGVRSANILSLWQQTPPLGFDYEARLDAPDGKLLGKGSMPAAHKPQQQGIAKIPLQPVKDNQLHKIYFIYIPQDPTLPMQAATSMIQFNSN